MQLRTLGGLAVEGAEFRRLKPLLLLSYLALEGAKDSKELSQLFFPNAKKPSQSLATALGRLRKELPGAVQREKPSKQLNTHVLMDASLLLNTLEAGDLERGLDLYKGSFLQGFETKDISAELEDWIYATREFIAHRVRQALLSLGEQTQDKTKASHYAEKRTLLSGAPEPSPEQFQRLYQLLANGDSHLTDEVRREAESFEIELIRVPQNLANPSRLDESPPQAINQADKPVSPQSHQETSMKHNLPERLTSFVGRENEVLELKGLISQKDIRLLTLLGTGGTGKNELGSRATQGISKERNTASLYGAIFRAA